MTKSKIGVKAFLNLRAHCPLILRDVKPKKTAAPGEFTGLCPVENSRTNNIFVGEFAA